MNVRDHVKSSTGVVHLLTHVQSWASGRYHIVETACDLRLVFDDKVPSKWFPTKDAVSCLTCAGSPTGKVDALAHRTLQHLNNPPPGYMYMNIHDEWVLVKDSDGLRELADRGDLLKGVIDGKHHHMFTPRDVISEMYETVCMCGKHQAHPVHTYMDSAERDNESRLGQSITSVRVDEIAAFGRELTDAERANTARIEETYVAGPCGITVPHKPHAKDDWYCDGKNIDGKNIRRRITDADVERCREMNAEADAQSAEIAHDKSQEFPDIQRDLERYGEYIIWGSRMPDGSVRVQHLDPRDVKTLRTDQYGNFAMEFNLRPNTYYEVVATPKTPGPK